MGWIGEQQERAAAGARRLHELVRGGEGSAGDLVALVVVAGGAATVKSVLIAGGQWGLVAQVGLLGGVVGVSAFVLRRTDGTVRALGLWPLDRDEADRRSRVAWTVVPPVVTGLGALAFAALTDHDVVATPGDLADLVLLVAVAEELIYRGAVLALARRALPALPAEILTGLAFVACHTGNGGGIIRFLGPAAGAVAFSWLRHRTGSLAGPVGGHLASNLPGKLLGLGRG